MIGFPLLLIPLAICNIIVFLMPGVAFDAPVFTFPMWSGNSWTLTLGDLLLSGGMLLLLMEISKSARPGGKYVTDHLLALLVFAGAAAEFVMLPQFASSTFFLLTVLALVDFLAGITLRSRTRRNRVAYAEPVAAPAPVAAPPAAPAVARPEPVVTAPPASTVPAATSVAEAVLLDRPAPVAGAATPAHTEAQDSRTIEPQVESRAEPQPDTRIEPPHPDGSPQVASPALQPVNDPHSTDKR
jgi:hypothetical protein